MEIVVAQRRRPFTGAPRSGRVLAAGPIGRVLSLVMSMRIYLDLSRLIYAAWRRTPAGIPRVELAYAEYFIANFSERLNFVVLDAFGRFCILDERRALDFVGAIANYWRADVASNWVYASIILRALRIHVELLFQRWGGLARSVRRHDERSVYIIPSQLHIERSRAIRNLKRDGRLKLVYVIHDILPTVFPEYFRPADEKQCERRMLEAARTADIVIANSADTARAFRNKFGRDRDPESIVVAPLGISIWRSAGAISDLAPAEPYFVMVGTIEPRKNHLLILNIWRALCAKIGNPVPRLIVVGTRGWENENVVDMLERTPGIRTFVHERGCVSDREMVRLFSGARALLMPSFAEGFGLPLAEALAQGLPVLCSDIPVFREVGGDVPEFIDPLDGLGWQRAIEEYALPHSPLRRAQLARLKAWSVPNWEDHFDILLSHIRRLSES